MPGSSQKLDEPPSLALLRQRLHEIANGALRDFQSVNGLDDKLTAIRVEQRDQAADHSGKTFSLADSTHEAAVREHERHSQCGAGLGRFEL